MKKITFIIAVLFLSSTIYAQTSITTDSVSKLPLCSGSTTIITYQTTGTFPFFGTTFTAQLSSSSGSFANPVNIGSTPINSKLILATIPKNTTSGIFYKVRVISSNPADTGTVSPNSMFIVQPSAFSQILELCQGGSKTLNASLPGAKYTWSNGATTQSITPSDTGIYSVTIKDPILNCKSTVSDTLTTLTCTVGVGIDENIFENDFSVYPNPGTGQFSIQLSNANTKDLVITITNLIGQEVYKICDKNDSSEYRKVIDIDHLPKGVYFLNLNLGTEGKTKKIIVQ